MFVLRVERGRSNGEFSGRAAMADGRLLNLGNGTYKVRAWISPDGRVTRGRVMQSETGATFHFQTGDRIGGFVEAVIENISSIRVNPTGRH